MPAIDLGLSQVAIRLEQLRERSSLGVISERWETHIERYRPSSWAADSHQKSSSRMGNTSATDWKEPQESDQ